jgi:drug/metabolite transporter (DMT)-like permease
MGSVDWAQLILLGILWGGSFFFARIAVQEIHPMVLVLYRVASAAVILHLWLLLRRLPFSQALPHAGSFFILAFVNNVVPFSLIFLGQTAIGAGLAAILNATTPFWTVIAANVLTSDEKITANKLGGIVLGIAGTAVMIGPSALTGFGAPLWAQLCVLGASLSYGLAAIYARRFRHLPSEIVATGQLTASSIIMIVLVGAVYGTTGLHAASLSTWAAVAALGIVSTALAFVIYFNLIASAGATNASLVTLIVPIGAVLLGALFLGEGLAGPEIAGMALIGLGLVTIDGRIFRFRARRTMESAEKR